MVNPTQEALPVATSQGVRNEERGCIVCGGGTSVVLSKVVDTRFGVSGEYEICRCVVCGLEQTLPRPRPNELKRLYEKYYNFGGEQGTRYTRWRDLFFSSWLYRAWVKVDGDGSFHSRVGHGRLLDIGCNEGRGLELYRRNGFSPEGLELNPRAAAVARSSGFTVYETLLEDCRPEALYDVVVLSNVLEHSLDPKRMLRDVARILKPGGEVWIACPNSDSWLRRRFGRAWINWHVPFHIVHFSSATLRELLVVTGFTEVEARQITPALWVASSFITRKFAETDRATGQLRNPFLILTLIAFVRAIMFPVLYFGNRRGEGDCLLVVSKSASPAGMP